MTQMKVKGTPSSYPDRDRKGGANRWPAAIVCFAFLVFGVVASRGFLNQDVFALQPSGTHGNK